MTSWVSKADIRKSLAANCSDFHRIIEEWSGRGVRGVRGRKRKEGRGRKKRGRKEEEEEGRKRKEERGIGKKEEKGRRGRTKEKKYKILIGSKGKKEVDTI